MSGAGTDHTRESITGGPAIILVEPQLGENIGMSARAMANFGLSELRLVNPRENWLNQKTEATAAGAVSILQNAQIFPTVEPAIADLNFLYATTARERGQGKEVVGPDQAGAHLKARIAQGQRQGAANPARGPGDECLSHADPPAPSGAAFQSSFFTQSQKAATCGTRRWARGRRRWKPGT